MANQMAILRKVLRRIRRYWVGLVASLLLATLYVVMSLYIPILVGNAIDCIIDAGRVDFTAMWGYLRNVAICAAVAALAQWLMNQINNHMTYGVTRDIRNEAFRHIQVLPLSYLSRWCRPSAMRRRPWSSSTRSTDGCKRRLCGRFSSRLW